MANGDFRATWRDTLVLVTRRGSRETIAGNRIADLTLVRPFGIPSFVLFIVRLPPYVFRLGIGPNFIRVAEEDARTRVFRMLDNNASANRSFDFNSGRANKCSIITRGALLFQTCAVIAFEHDTRIHAARGFKWVGIRVNRLLGTSHRTQMSRGHGDDAFAPGRIRVISANNKNQQPRVLRLSIAQK